MHAISSYHGNRPTHTQTHIHRKDRLQNTAPQLVRSVTKQLTSINYGYRRQVTWRQTYALIGRPCPHVLQVMARGQCYVQAVCKLWIPQQCGYVTIAKWVKLKPLLQIPVVVAYRVQVHCTHAHISRTAITESLSILTVIFHVDLG